MSETYFMGYKINKNIKHFTSNTVLFSNETDSITVTMAKDFLDYILGLIAIKNPMIEKYQKAKKVFLALKNWLDNRHPHPPNTDDIKATIDVLEEIKNMSANSDDEKAYNSKYALFCKMIIDGFTGGMT